MYVREGEKVDQWNYMNLQWQPILGETRKERMMKEKRRKARRRRKIKRLLYKIVNIAMGIICAVALIYININM